MLHPNSQNLLHQRVVVILFLALVGAAGTLFPAESTARDSDESRLGATEHPLGTSAEGELAPPEDDVDWRYIKVEEPRTIAFSLEVEPEGKDTTLTLTRATGDELEEVAADTGSAEIETELQPGLYYIQISASSAIEYTLTIGGV